MDQLLRALASNMMIPPDIRKNIDKYMNPIIAMIIRINGKKISPRKIFENPQVSFIANQNTLPKTANNRIIKNSVNMAFSPFLQKI